MSQTKDNSLNLQKIFKHALLLAIIIIAFSWIHHINQFLQVENESRRYIGLNYFTNTTYIDESNFTCISNNRIEMNCFDESDKLGVYDALLFYGSDLSFFSTGFILLLIVLIHNTRMALGFNLYDRDSTFFAAKKKYFNLKVSKLSIDDVNAYESIIRLFMALSLFALLLGISSYGPLYLLAILIFQSILIAIYLCLFKVVLFRIDTNRDANKFILCTDITYFIIVLNLILLFVMSNFSINSNYYIYKYIFIMLFGGYLVMFIGELVISYGESIKKGAKDFRNDICKVYKISSKALFSRSEYPPHKLY